MARIKTLKRRLVREAVRENVELLSGSVRPRRRRDSGLFRFLLRGTALVGLPLALFVSINAISTGGSGKPEVVVVPQRAAPDARIEELPWPAPRMIDPTVFNLGVQTVVLDPGHGGSDPGASSAAGLVEKAVNLDISLRMRKLLEEASVHVVMTRATDEAVPLRERARLAKASGGDLFLSIHVNSVPSVTRRVVETYYLGPTDDPEIRQLAGAENSGSGYSLADFRKLLEGVYLGVRQAESRSFATAVHGELASSLKRQHSGVEDRGVKSAPFVVLIASEMPSILAEVSCLTNADEASRLGESGYRQGIAEALVRGIQAYADGRNRGSRKGS